jgi:AraC-like DNA-binding protein
MGVPNLTTRYARAMIFSAERKGLDLAQICRAGRLPPEAIGPDVDYIESDTLIHLNQLIKMALDDDFCGFTRERCKPGSIALVCEAMVCEETIAEALKSAFRLYAFITDEMSFELQDETEYATITLKLSHPEIDTFHYLHEWWLMIWPHICGWLIGEEFPVTSASLPYAPDGPVSEYDAAFWGPCLFMQPQAQVRFPASLLKRRVIRTLTDFRTDLFNYRSEVIHVPGIRRSWKAVIKQRLTERLANTECLLSIDEIAQEFNMGSKTLRRRLDDEGITFRELKEEIRREAILRLLSEPNIPIGEVSLRAGFSERNGLVRAVRLWVGVSPREYRNMIVGRGMEDSPRTETNVLDCAVTS